MAPDARGARTWQVQALGRARPAAVGGTAALVAGAFLLVFGTIWLGVTLTVAFATGTVRAVVDDDLVRVEGTVVSLERRAMDDGGSGCRSIVGFVGLDGVERTATDGVTRSPCQSLGTEVGVLLDPADPAWSQVDPVGGFLGWFLGAFAAIGLVLLVSGAFAVWRGARAIRRARRSRATPSGPPGTSGPPGPAGQARGQGASMPGVVVMPGSVPDATAPGSSGAPPTAPGTPGSGARVAPPLF
ncbi:DUF3592 domain-containing protein [Sanguibacter sp. HDW7]|uniref:DUF3592 domain-containing protein n=1 Tax=Sanguibacter sp. HDW7 TaxID=2714931 RepID=UPI0014088226|nr:DUF3592 domain-containing protein [Sanguibacter sp. HDW7]QIK83984.1 DUF3592 domain-containing protein [Sanguibacter sp. HDW7]